MNKKPFFSIVMPAYNRADSISSSIESCLKQTYTNFELIIIDDGSKDNLSEVINNYNDKRIKYIYRENGGGGAARNTGIKVAQGEYIAFLDSDDSFMDEKLQKAYNYLTSNDCDCIYTQVYVDRGVGKYWIKPPIAIGENENMADYVLRRKGWLATSTIVIRASSAKEILFDESLCYGQDTDFVIRLYNAGVKFKMLDDIMTLYIDIVDKTRISTSTHPYKKLIEWVDSIKDDIPAKAYYGYKGWHVAKATINVKPMKAIFMYISALFKGCYSFKMAMIVFCQIFIPTKIYRNLTDFVAEVIGKKGK